MAELRSIDGGKKEPCPWCGQDAHPVPLMCRRIAYVVMNRDEDVVEVHFWAEDDEPPDAA